MWSLKDIQMPLTIRVLNDKHDAFFLFQFFLIAEQEKGETSPKPKTQSQAKNTCCEKIKNGKPSYTRFILRNWIRNSIFIERQIRSKTGSSMTTGQDIALGFLEPYSSQAAEDPFPCKVGGRPVHFISFSGTVFYMRLKVNV